MVDIGLGRAPANARRAWIALAIASFLGLLSLAAVQSIRVDCRDIYLTADDGRPLTTDNGELLTTGQRSCRLTF